MNACLGPRVIEPTSNHEDIRIDRSKEIAMELEDYTLILGNL